MKITSNKLSVLYNFYKTELSLLYSEDEIFEIFGLVCEKYLGISKNEIKSNFDLNVNQSDLLKIYDAAKALKRNNPIQYVLNEAFFYNSVFFVNPSVLIPRPETEELVDIIIKDLMAINDARHKILDIGTGSGCIAVSLKKHIPSTSVYAIDFSNEALETAKKNAFLNNVSVAFNNVDILNLNACSFMKDESPFTLIVSNPPYIKKSESQFMHKNVLDHEPHVALFVNSDDPIIFYKEIIDLCHTNLTAKGWLYFELNPLFAQDVKNYADLVNLFNFTELLHDMSGKIRFFKAQKK